MAAAEARPELDLSAPLPNEFGFEYIEIRLPAEWQLTEATFLELCDLNDGWSYEATADGNLIVMPPSARIVSCATGNIMADVSFWSRRNGGDMFGPDGLVHLPDNAMMAPDTSWLSPERVDERPDDYAGELISVCPDFVVEVRNASDSVARQQEKMQQWLAYGARLGWLIDAYNETVWIYREGQEAPEELDKPTQLSGENILPGLIVEMSRIWA